MIGMRSWVDVHFPCEGHIKVLIRGALPEAYLESSKIQPIITGLLGRLGIRQDETYEATFFKPTRAIQIGSSVNREGMTDRLES